MSRSGSCPPRPSRGLGSIDDTYRRNHRGGDIGQHGIESTGDRTAAVTGLTPYPCEADRGLARAAARRYAAVELLVFVEERGDRRRRDGDVFLSTPSPGDYAPFSYASMVSQFRGRVPSRQTE